MTNTNDLPAQAHPSLRLGQALAAGMQKLEALRRQFLAYLERKEQEVLMRMTTGTNGAVTALCGTDLSDWPE